MILTQDEENLVFGIYCRLSRPVTKEKLEEAEKAGMIGKATLKDGQHYWGECRNARVAIWSSQIQLFVHWRYKFGYHLEDIPHPADDDGFDIFVPMKEISTLEIGENDGKVSREVSAEQLKGYIQKHLEWKERQAEYTKRNPK